MKITIQETIEREFTIPSKYLKHLSWYYMVIDHETMLTVKDFDKSQSALQLYPEVRVERLSYSSIKEATPISETEFKNAFLRVSLRIEETLNN